MELEYMVDDILEKSYWPWTKHPKPLIEKKKVKSNANQQLNRLAIPFDMSDYASNTNYQ